VEASNELIYVNTGTQRIPPLGEKNPENMEKVLYKATARQELYVKMLSTERYLLACSVRFSQQELLS
jgi:hypothetical protein